MFKIVNHFPLFLLLFLLISLNSCLEQPSAPKPLSIDSVSQAHITISYPEANDRLLVDFHPSVEPFFKNGWRMVWDFGDSTSPLELNDTSDAIHKFSNFGQYTLTLSVIDTGRSLILKKIILAFELTDSVVDSNSLHEFNRITILLRCLKNYGQSYDDTTDLAVGSFGGLVWKGNNFFVTGGTYYHSQNGRWDSTNKYSNSIFEGTISHTGNKIEIGSYSYSYSYYYTNRGGEGGENSGSILEYKSLPLIVEDQSKRVYSYTGANLKELITRYRDSSTWGYNMNISSKHLDKVIWDQEPTPLLMITLYK